MAVSPETAVLGGSPVCEPPKHREWLSGAVKAQGAAGGLLLWSTARLFKALRSQRSGFLEPSPCWDVEKLCVVMDSVESQELRGSES